MATHADISGNLAIGALQAVRRNVTNTAFEAYTPYTTSGAATTYPTVVSVVALTDISGSISPTGLLNTDVPGIYSVNSYMYATAIDDLAPLAAQVELQWTDDAGSKQDTIDTANLQTLIPASGNYGYSFVVHCASGSISYSVTAGGGSFLDARCSLYLVIMRLAEIGTGALSGLSAGVATLRATLAAGILQVYGTAAGATTVTGTVRGSGAAGGAAAGAAAGSGTLSG